MTWLYSVLYHQDGVEFALEGDEIPGFLRGSKKGNIFITTQKVSHKNVSLFSVTVEVALGYKTMINLSSSLKSREI